MKVEYNERFNFNHITAEDGMVITDWNGEDIKEYSSAKEMYCPVTVDLSRYYEISEAQDAEYMEMQQKAIEDMRLKD